RELALANGLQDKLAFQHVETIESIPFADHAFDGILCSSVIEYLDNPELCLSEFSRLIRPGGWLLLTVPNRRCALRRTLRLIFGVSRAIGRPWPRWLAVSKNEYDPDSLRDLLAQHALQPVRVSFLGGPLSSWLKRRRFFGPLLLVLARKNDT